jgi:hypothetical protein
VDLSLDLLLGWVMILWRLYIIYIYVYIYMIIKIYYGPGHNYRTEVEEHKLIIEQPKINCRTGSESARNRDPEEYESTVFYCTFVLLIPLYNCGNSCNIPNDIPQIYPHNIPMIFP